MNLLVDRLARMLDPKERDAVLGDLVECNETELRAAVSLLGLIVRRQTALWKDWRPWVAVVGLIGIVCPVLATVSLVAGQPLIREFITHWTVGVFYTDGNLSVPEVFFMPVCSVTVVLLSSWICGAALAYLSRRTLWLSGSLYFLIWTFPLPIIFSMFRQYMLGRLELRPFGLFEWMAQAALHILCFVVPSVLGLRYVRTKRFNI